MIKKKKWHGPLSHWRREGKTLVVRPFKKTFLMCVFPHSLNMCTNALQYSGKKTGFFSVKAELFLMAS